MADNPITPTTPIARTPTATTGSTAQGDAQITKLLQSLASSRNPTLSATLVNFDASGNPVLQTPQGRVSVSAQLTLPQGAELTLKPVAVNVPGQSPSLNLQILAVNGKPLDAYLAATTSSTSTASDPKIAATPINTLASAATTGSTNRPGVDILQPLFNKPQQPNVTASQQPTPSTQISLSTPDIVEAIVLNPSPNALALLPAALRQPQPQKQDFISSLVRFFTKPDAPQIPTALNTQDQLQFRVLNQIPPQIVQTSPQTGTAPAQQPAAQTPLASPPPNITSSQNLAQPQTNNLSPTQTPGTASLNTAPPPSAVTLPSAAPLANTTSLPNTSSLPNVTSLPNATNAIPATVIGQEGAGSTIVESPLGTLRISVDSPYPRGTQLTLEPLTLKPAPNLVAQAIDPETQKLEAIRMIETQRTSLDTLMSQLKMVNPETFENISRTLIPQPNREFAAKTLWFLTGIRDGSWSEVLKQELPHHPKLQETMQKFQGELQTLRSLLPEQTTAQATQQQWSGVLVPVLDGNELRYFTIFHQDHQDPQQPDAKGTRFLVELTLDIFGALQLDGFVQQRQNKKRFNLVFRSQKNLSAEDQEAIRDIFTGAIEISGMAGSLQFDVSEKFVFRPIEQLLIQARS